ncbi:MAG: AI-2E family transporter [Piscirickettsiaceae bacterium]|nr:AI-2E family transporter [Piscirickettsiaceae bacterium]
MGLLIDLFAGILNFIPYLGLIIGIIFSGISVFLQFYDLMPVIIITPVFVIARMIKVVVLTPRSVGGHIGLHPVALILSGGQLFNLIGALLALPIASSVMSLHAPCILTLYE